MVGGDDDDSVEAALGYVNIAVLTSLPLDKLAAMHSAPACAIQSPPQNSRSRWATYWF